MNNWSFVAVSRLGLLKPLGTCYKFTLSREDEEQGSSVTIT